MIDPKAETLFKIQKEMQKKLSQINAVDFEKVHYVGGADLTCKDDLFIGCFVVVDFKDEMKVIYSKCTEMRVDVPYVPGLLCFREGPVVTALYREFCLAHPEIKIDVILVDGSGEWHIRGFGLACYVGIELGIPTIGVFKQFLYVGSEHSRDSVHEEAQTKLQNIGDVLKLQHVIENGTEIHCGVLKTTDTKPFREIFVTPGHMIDIDTSIEIVKKTCIFREPEPLRLADRISRQYQSEKQNNTEASIVDTKTKVFHLIIALDCTGSMGSAITNIKNSLSNLVSIIKNEFPNVIISFYGVRDYCDSKVITKKTFMNDCIDAKFVISQETARGGGDSPEAHKTCLAEMIMDIRERAQDMINVCLFITDAPPHFRNNGSNNYSSEQRYLSEKQIKFAQDWIELSKMLDYEGIQVFSFLTDDYHSTTKPFSVLSYLTHALSFIIPNSSATFEAQMKSIIFNLINNTDATIVDGIKMLLPGEDCTTYEKEDDLSKSTVQNIYDKEEISKALAEKRILMRLKPSERGAKRVMLSSKELIQKGTITIKALKSFFKIMNGDNSGYKFLDETKEFTLISKQMKEAKPSKEWLNETSVSCIFSMMTLTDAFDELNSFDEEKAEAEENIVNLVKIIGNFVIGYPFLFQLNEDGKFNMQDSWPIVLKDVSTSYTMSISSLFDIIQNEKEPSEEIISQFKDLIGTNEKSGIVPICSDVLSSFIIKILDVTKWLDALVSYGLHRHIEPLAAITRATCNAFICRLLYQSFKDKEGKISVNEREALELVAKTLEAMNSKGCKDMMFEFESKLKDNEIPFNAFSPQNPYNCNGINKLLNCFFQLKPLIATADHDFMIKFFHQAINETVSIFVSNIDEKKRDEYISQIFPRIELDPENYEEQNPLELAEPVNFKEFQFNIIEPNLSSRFSIFLFKTIWSLLRSDEFEAPSPLLITSFIAQSNIMKKSFKYQKVGNKKENNKDEEEMYEIKPIFATQDPNEILRIACFFYLKRINAENILALQDNRKQYLIKEAVELLIEPFRNCDLDEFWTKLNEGFQLYWMEEPYKLSMIDAEQIFTTIIDKVKRVDPQFKKFYRNVFLLIALGKDKESHSWCLTNNYRNVNVVQQYVDQFLDGSEKVMDYYMNNLCRPMPNRHGHHAVYCPNQLEYTEEYARKRLLCAIAPFRLIEGIPRTIYSIKYKTIAALSKKIGAPPYEDILEFAESLKNEAYCKL
ncbi:hypothetical protein M9Y10_032161 [Tritrichomonas musculus]|uniref:VWFA domain-containing protein n=1 Tax=Tritrichomonas musculus TaxID=1915356 RepID=A0ABR2H0A5_9EUKA